MLSLLLLSAIPYHTSGDSGAFIQFELTTADPNHLILECYSSFTVLLDEGAVIQFFKNASQGADPHANVSSGAVFDVTAENEALLRCTSSDGNFQSDFVAIAGKGEMDFFGLYTCMPNHFKGATPSGTLTV